MTVSGKTYWLVGASEGLGRALARALDAEGARLVLSARNGARLESLCAGLQNARAVPMDVCDPIAVATCAQTIGPIDGVIYAAGTYAPMRAQDWSPEALEMVDVNFTGAMRVLGACVPDFVARDRGDIILIGSLAGLRGLPGAIGYGASKAALAHLAENLRADLYHSNVAVKLVTPGYINTRLTAKNDFAMPMMMAPEDAAHRVVRALQNRRFETRFPRPFSWLFGALRLLPARLYFPLVARR